MAFWASVGRDELRKRLPTMSEKNLEACERIICAKMDDCDRFYPWPALKESYSQDLQAIWDEQKRRRAERKDYGNLLRKGR